MAEFKIGRLRFSWDGEWTPGTFYNRDSVVQYNGKTYVCIVPNTSNANFYEDLYYTTPGGAFTPYWNLVIEGQTWKGSWTPNTLYSLGNLVLFGGVTYICIEAHTSDDTAIDPTMFDIYNESSSWSSAWEIDHAYGIGDLVKYGGIVYRCIENHVSAPSLDIGLEDDISKWTLLYVGIEYKGAWSDVTRYKLNDVVSLNGNLYIATLGHTAVGDEQPFNDSVWTVWLPGEKFGSTWSNLAVYQPGDVVMYGGYAYVSNTINNENKIPSTEADWSLLNLGYRFLNEYGSSGSAYKVGDVVRNGGMLYEAILDSNGQNPSQTSIETTYTAVGSSGTTLKVADTTGIEPGMVVIGLGFSLGQTVQETADTTTLILNQAPDGTLVDEQDLTFVGLNATYWDILVPGVHWNNGWVLGNQYKLNDLVRWKNGTYKCLQPHLGTVESRPDADTTYTYWSLYIPHARKNALTTFGDIETYNNDQYEAISIGTESFTLRVTSDLPTWSHINTIPKVYYVSTTGTDISEEGYGLTWDKPWRTIKYACDTISEGFTYKTTADIIRQNKSFLASEVYNYLDYNSYTGDLTKASRDASFIIDAIVYDLLRGGNSQIVAATLSYFAFGSSSTFINPNVYDQINDFIAALENLRTQINTYVVNNNSVPGSANYQLLNNVPSIDINAQVTFTSYEIDTAANAYVSNLLNILITALTDQSTLSVPASNSGITASIMVKTGTYKEVLPIVVPENVAVIGDELRSVVVSPATSITTYCTATTAESNLFTVDSTEGLVDGMVLQFVAPLVLNVPTPFGGIESGVNYYVVGTSITPTQFAVTSTASKGTMNVLVTDGDTNIDISTVLTKDDVVAGVYISGDGIPDGTYVVSKTDDVIVISNEPNGVLLGSGFVTIEYTAPTEVLTTESGAMTVYAGDCLKDMFYLRNGTGLRNMTVNGLLGTLTEANEFTTKRPTGGAFASLDPGNGPEDTSAWIFRRSPYVQNVTAFGNGVAGLKIDGNLHNGGNKSIVANDFTHIISDGIGVWCTGSGSLTECVSIFSYYGYMGYLAEDGGRIRATNGNTSYGTYGVVAEGYDILETPTTGNVFNRSTQTQAQVQSAFGSTAQLIKINYSNAGSEYDSSTHNLLLQTNEFTTSPWTSDGNVSYSKINEAPSGIVEAWSLTGSSTATTGYVSQTVTVTPKGAVYTNVPAVTISGGGYDATFNITVTATEYIVTVNNPGTNYSTTNQLYIAGGQLGGRDTVNNCVLTVTGLSGSGVQQVSVTGVVPIGSNLNYTASIYIKQGTASEIDIWGIFSGVSVTEPTSKLNYNFNTGTLTASSENSGYTPFYYGAEVTLASGWYRLWFSFYDTSGLNDQLEYRIYPKGITGQAGAFTTLYGSQLEISGTTHSPSFYLENTNSLKTAYANYNITGAGTGAEAIGDEIRSLSVFQTRITDPGSGAGGDGYLTSSNNGQSGTDAYIQLAQSDNNTEANYIGMRLFINSGTGAGQYGYISAYDEGTKFAQILKESFNNLEVTNTASSGNKLTLGVSYTTDTLYVDQAIQFIPTYYTTSITATSLAQATVTATVGGLTNTLQVSTTLGMVVNMGVSFTGATYSTVTPGYTYYIYSIDTENNLIQISDQLYGNVWPLTTGSGVMAINYSANNSYLSGSTLNMVVNYPIQFTGTALGGLTVGSKYYINDIQGISQFSISNSLVDITVTATNPGDDSLTVASTSSIVPLNPIVFSGTVVGNIVEGTKYYISKIIDSFKFTVSETLISINATETEAVSNFITVSSTTNFVINNPIQFVGTVFGGIVAETVYYILAINNSQTFTVSQTPGGGAISLTTASGLMTARTCPSPFQLASSSGASMSGTSTSTKKALTLGLGSMNGTFSTSLFGGVSAGTTYYVKTIDALNKQLTITDSPGGSTAVTLTTKTGSMNLAAVGWDHINPGTPIETSLDNSSVYFIEPRTTYSEPAFTQDTTTTVALSGSTNWSAIAYGDHYWIALPTSDTTAAGTADGSTWNTITLPSVQSWTSIAYGSGYWVAISSGGSGNSKAIYSNSNGLGWRTVNLPSATSWSKVVYGAGKFVAVSAGGLAARSVNFGATWVAAGSPTGLTNITGLTYGKGKFVAVSSNGNSAYSIDGLTWVVTTPITASAWADITYGSGRFVAVPSTSAKSAYSFDAITWYESLTPIIASKIAYGQGIFVAFPDSGSTTGYTSESGLTWKKQTVIDDGNKAVSFGFTDDTVEGRPGYFVTLGDATVDNVGTVTSAGVRTKGRAIITSGVITGISEFEPGSGYQTTPSVTFTDPNITALATVSARISNGTLASPTFLDNGSGYNTNSTRVLITGNGYADIYQTGLSIVMNNLTRLPQPGDNLTFDGIDEIYKVTSATVVYGTTVPNLEANVEISPDMSVALSPENGTAVSIRAKYSQARLTNHDFLNIGYGTFETSNYPGYPDSGYSALYQNQVLEINYGRVFFTSTDQDGNFKVGNLFGVQQATGIVTLSATQFGLTGLSTLSLGGIAVGGSSVVISQFSTDGSFTANSDEIVSTQKAIKTYLQSRLTQGGSNTFTGQLIAGTIVVGGPDKIGSTVPNGSAGSNVIIPGMVRFQGQSAGVDGDLAAMDYFVRGFTRRGNYGNYF